MRLQLARDNHIPFTTIECLSKEPCAGTCEQCDVELDYIQQQLQYIPENERVYPHYKIDGAIEKTGNILYEKSDGRLMMGMEKPPKWEGEL